MQVRTATGLIAAYMRACKFDGWTSFWNIIYVLPGFEHDERLLRHERKHLKQIERDGRIKFALRYSWWTIHYGYWRNPYEVEAREAEHQTQNKQKESKGIKRNQKESKGIKMNSTIITAVVRHALTGIGGALAAQYSIDGTTMEAVIGGIAAAAGLIWSLLEKSSRPKA